MRKPKDETMSRIQAEYITGTATLRELAKKYGVTFQRVRDCSYSQNWVAQRTAYRQQVRDGAIELSLKRDRVDFQIVVDNSMRVLQMIEEITKDSEALRRYVAVETTKAGGDMSSEMVERTFQRVDMGQLKQLVESQKIVTDGLLKLFGVPTQAERASQQIAADRLALDRDKFEAEQAKDTDSEITIRMEIPEGFDA